MIRGLTRAINPTWQSITNISGHTTDILRVGEQPLLQMLQVQEKEEEAVTVGIPEVDQAITATTRTANSRSSGDTITTL